MGGQQIFSDIFRAFGLDNPPGVKEKNVQKRKNFSTKKLDALQPPTVQWGIPRGYPPPPPGGGEEGGEQLSCQGVGTIRAAALFSYPYL
jgi:hypothetical protein